MESLRLTLCTVPLLLAGCLALSSVNWSAANPWNWFGSSTRAIEQGVGTLTGVAPPDEKTIADALDGDYRLCSGMKTNSGNVVRFYEAMKDDKLAIVINGSQGTISRTDVLDHDISLAAGAEIGTSSSDLYTKALGNYQKATSDDGAGVKCKAEGSQHISYIFSGEWNGPEDIMPFDNTPKVWKVSRAVWRRQFASEQTSLLKKQVEWHPSMPRCRSVSFSGKTMSQVQSGTLSEHCRAAIWTEANIKGDVDIPRAASETFTDKLVTLEARFPDAHLGAVVVFGDNIWHALSGGVDAEELKDSIPYGKGLASATRYDVLIHIFPLRHDVNFPIAQAATETFDDRIEVKEETHGLRWIEECDLSGFVDGTENPADEEARHEVVVIRDGMDAGGSYAFVQCWEHNLK